VKREDYLLMDIDDGFLQLMSDATSELREDLKCPDDAIGTQLQADYAAGKSVICTVLKACGEEAVIAVKQNTAAEK